MVRLPFSIPDAHGGLADVQGLAFFEDDTLTLEFEAKDAFFGVVTSGLKTTQVAIDDLVSLTYKHHLFWTTLVLQARSMQAFSDIPGQKQGALKLKAARKHRLQAEQLTSRITLRISERRLERLDTDLNLLL